ncbi:MAG: ComEA family DNA-binding protein [Thalassotalea sp.]
MIYIRKIFYIVLLTLTPFFLVANDKIAEAASLSSEVIQLIDINKADMKTLAKLKGIGKSKAQAIINYRELNGNFKSLDELLKIKGIGKKVLLENKAMLTI